MKVAVFFSSPDMYSHDINYRKTIKLEGNDPNDVWNYFVNECGGATVAKVQMFIADSEAQTFTIHKEFTKELKVKIIINKKEKAAVIPKKDFFDDMSWPSAAPNWGLLSAAQGFSASTSNEGSL